MNATSRACLRLLALVAALAAAGARAEAQSLIGALYVTTDPPGAAVYVNAELKGISPCGIPDVGAGAVEVKAEKQGYAAAIVTANVEGDRTTEVSLSLARLSGVGSIAVLVEPPGSPVEVDRVPAGRTPVVVINVAAGTHRVTVGAQGFRPMQSTVTVAPGQQFVLKGRLEPLQAVAIPTAPAHDLETLGELNEDQVPPIAQLPEEQVFDGVRKLLSDRRYDEALRALDALAADPAMRKYAERIGRERRFAGRIEQVVNAGYEELRKAKGQEYALLLRKGIRLTGRLVDVTETEAVLAQAGTEKRIPLPSIAADHVVRLASVRLDPADPANRVSLALLYAAEGEFESSYKQLRAAAMAGADITGARSYVDAEHLWAAALRKDAAERLRARVTGLPAPQQLSRQEAPVPLLVDTYRGESPPADLAAVLNGTGFAQRQLTGPFSPRDAEKLGVLLICDPGGTRPVPPYDRQEMQSIMDFLSRGGGLVFVGKQRPTGQQAAPHPFGALLQWCGIGVRLDELSVSDDAPKEYPGEYALSIPATPHPVTYGVARVVFPLASPSLEAANPAWVLVRTVPVVGSRQAGEAAPAMVAARGLREGRILVMASLPVVTRSPVPESGLFNNNANLLLRNGMLWVSEPARQQDTSGTGG